MKNNSIVRKTAIILMLSLVTVLFSGCGKERVDALESLSFKSDIVEVSVLGETVKIDCILPGLDTYSFKTILWDMNKDEQLSETSFEEGAWLSGLTDNGFYAVDTQAKELYIYNKAGDCTKQQKVADAVRNLSAARLSTCENYFAYYDSEKSTVVIRDMLSGRETAVETEYAVRDIIDFRDGQFYAVSVTAELIAVDVSECECRLALADSRVKLFSADFCLGETPTNFLLANENECLYVPINSADEMVVGLGRTGFCTEVANEELYVINCYNVREKLLSSFQSSLPVEKLCFTEKGDVIAVLASAKGGEHTVKVFTPKSFRVLEIFDKDVVGNKGEIPSVPGDDVSQNASLIENVPLIHQFPEYPTGCEAVSAVMALQYAGEKITVGSFINRYLPTSRDFYLVGAKNYGPSPYEYFVGDPRTTASYGCMAPVIEKAVVACVGDSERVKNTEDIPLDALCKQYIDNDIPVLVWATIEMKETEPRNTWYFSNGKRFTWPGNEHCMLLVGYDEDNYYFNDPYTGSLVAFEKELTEARYAELGHQSLVILG